MERPAKKRGRPPLFGEAMSTSVRNKRTHARRAALVKMASMLYARTEKTRDMLLAAGNVEAAALLTETLNQVSSLG